MQQISSHYRTVVVGAGPAGIAAAREAAATGTVLLVEASALPRSKSCGGMLNPSAMACLRSMGLTPPEHLVREPRYVRFRYVDWDRRIHKETLLRFLNVDRDALDSWMLEHLPDSVTVTAGANVHTVEQGDDGATLEFDRADAVHRVTCETLIGADGARSSVRRAVGALENRAYVTIQDRVLLQEPLSPLFDCVYMRGIGDCFGYSYVVPKGAHALVGSVFYPKTKHPHAKHEYVMERLRERMPALGPTADREAAAALYLRSGADVLPGIGRVLMAGEAGGFISPTSGEGISYAVRTGRAAGMAASGPPSSALATYEAAVMDIRREIGRKLRWLPLMESRTAKYLAGYLPEKLISGVTMGL